MNSGDDTYKPTCTYFSLRLIILVTQITIYDSSIIITWGLKFLVLKLAIRYNPQPFPPTSHPYETSPGDPL